MKVPKKTVLFLVGPTGSGKTELSLCLAKRLGCEIISADSMLVYKGMDIGTAKPAEADRRKIPHHLIDIVSPRKNYSVHLHRKLALETIEQILKRGRIPLLVGGSGLYVDAIWKGLSRHPAGNPKLRAQLNREADKKGLPFLYRRLKSLDSAQAGRIHPNDRRRVIRALEIIKLSGKTPSEWYQKRESLEDLGYSVRIIGIQRDRVNLYERINSRVEKMFRKGLIEEVKRIKKKGFSRTARGALGYQEVLDYLRHETKSTWGELSLLIQKKTRHFAKRQLTWLRRQKEIRWISWPEGEGISPICDKIVRETKLWLSELS
ncbi:MAG: tRNA (adenosine(37)-N6)-dimethylallyltransferase MiaA [Candidatus Omnitrophica bacterium]|nr:tRNA (adenosine(37)-N6)-dimethylallyltransferase MiaA [Candidatus Omnitrophota bacterium]